ncbi:MAG: GH3 auxin-responsive promoter family protein [Bacteroidetes bacterium]|nr:GH3 auxin-responsive promoter family protein [Bacteroidota bacterium]
MPFNSVFSWFIKKRIHQIDLFRKHPIEVQEEWFEHLLEMGEETRFGEDHGFAELTDLASFKAAVPIRNYEEIKDYIDRCRAGEEDVLWPGKVKWFAKSSGTTSDRSKFIPVTKEALEECHYKGGKDLLAMYCNNHQGSQIYKGKTLVMGGSSNLSALDSESITGDLSAIIINNLPIWVELRRTPGKDIALMDNWEEKIEKMALAVKDEDVTTVAGVPSWTLVLFKRILELTGKNTIKEVWPNFELFMHGGVSFKPYRQQFDQIVGHPRLNYYQTYNASEGFFGIQDEAGSDDLLLMLDYGIFYEFLPMEHLGNPHAPTLQLDEVSEGVIYALIISTNAGLWRYMLGDTIVFTSTDPYRIQVVGRTRLFINAFGEELIIDNAEEGIRRAAIASGAVVNDFTAGPIYMENSKCGGHEWIIEFDQKPKEMKVFAQLLDDSLKELNTDYEAKRSSDLSLGFPTIKGVPSGTFYEWMKSKGKLGGQNKVPRLSNDRRVLEEVNAFLEEEKVMIEQ